jgi:ABC-type bacteriocin/lantibiotic exporter with double-glycine peptidase domain
VPQDVYLFDSSIKDNITMNKCYDRDLFLNVIKTARLSELIEEYGDSYYVGDNGKKLSGGQRQRISLARALYQQKDVLVLDEFTSALDIETSKNLLDMVSKIDGKIIILISHDHDAKNYFKRQLELT